METERPDIPNDKFVDEVLEASLAGYSRTEPRAGLEARVLRHLEEARQTRSLGWLGRWQWAAAGAFAIIVVFAGVLTLRERPATQTQGQVAANEVAKQSPGAQGQLVVSPVQVAALVVPPANRAPRFNRVRPGAAVARMPAANAAPRLAVFPAPAPPSEQEMLLARVVAAADPATLEALSKASQAPLQDLEIKPLKIEPLAGSEEASKETPNPGSVPNP